MFIQVKFDYKGTYKKTGGFSTARHIYLKVAALCKETIIF